jgi:hypothetical protein
MVDVVLAGFAMHRQDAPKGADQLQALGLVEVAACNAGISVLVASSPAESVPRQACASDAIADLGCRWLNATTLRATTI